MGRSIHQIKINCTTLILQFKYVQLIECQLYLTKVEKKVRKKPTYSDRKNSGSLNEQKNQKGTKCKWTRRNFLE